MSEPYTTSFCWRLGPIGTWGGRFSMIDGHYQPDEPDDLAVEEVPA
jgi:hypothetical protein